MIARIAWMLARPGTAGRATIVLPAVAFATVTALLLIVIGGAQQFFQWNDGEAIVYQASAVIALTLLVVPLTTLGAAASRLSARRQDDRLATLRLLGASPLTVTAITALESSVVALAGAIGGVVLYLLASPLVGLINFRGEALGTAVLLPPLAILAVVIGVALLAAGSAALGLRRIIISPLGVRMRQEAPRPHWIRVVIAIAVIALTNVVMGFVGMFELAIILSLLVFGFGGTLLVLNIVGPWVLKLIATAGVRRAATPERLLAARAVLESPRTAWSQVSGVAMTSFMGVFAGCGVAVLEALGTDAENEFLYTDIRTGLIITVIASFLMVACSVGVNQAAAALDRADLYSSLATLGMPVDVMDAARRRTVMVPLRVTAIGSAAIAAIVALPLTGAALLLAPLSVATIAGVIAAGILLVWLGLRATRPVLESAARIA